MITLNGKTLDEFGLTLQPGQQNAILPSTNDMILTVPGRHGAYDFGAYMQPKYFNLPLVWAKEINRTKLQERINAFVTLLTDIKGKPKTIELRFDSEPEKWYTVRYSGALDIQRLLSLGFFNLPLVAFDPFKYASNTAYEEQIDYGQFDYDADAIYVNPDGFEWTATRHMSSLYNYSYFETFLALKIEGTIANARIENLTTGEIHYIPSITNGVLEIDGATYKVIKNGANGMSESDGDFISLTSGTNELVFYADNPDAVVTYTWKHRFL